MPANLTPLKFDINEIIVEYKSVLYENIYDQKF